MGKAQASILISSHDRVPLLRRTLYSIAARPPSCPFEVVLADDGSGQEQEDAILSSLREFSSCFPWKFVRVDTGVFQKETGVRPYFNNPALTNNVAFRHSEGEAVYLQGNEVIAWGPCYDALRASSGGGDSLVFSTTYDLQTAGLDRYGYNLTAHMVACAAGRPLQSSAYRSDVTNYLSLCPRHLWEAVGGYDERYVGGISSEDSDFVRRVRRYGATTLVSDEAVSLHQYHQGKTLYYDPPEAVITRERWQEGVRRNHEIYDAWDGTPGNPQPWPVGTLGVADVVTG